MENRTLSFLNPGFYCKQARDYIASKAGILLIRDFIACKSGILLRVLDFIASKCGILFQVKPEFIDPGFYCV